MFPIQTYHELAQKPTMDHIRELSFQDVTVHRMVELYQHGYFDNENEMLISMVYALCSDKSIYIDNLKAMYTRHGYYSN